MAVLIPVLEALSVVLLMLCLQVFDEGLVEFYCLKLALQGTN